MTTHEWMGVGAALGLWYWLRHRKPQASAVQPAQTGWLEHAPLNPTSWFGDQWQALNGGNIAPANPVPGNSAVAAGAPMGYYVDPTNQGGTLLSANASGAYQASVGKDPMLALFGTAA